MPALSGYTSTQSYRDEFFNSLLISDDEIVNRFKENFNESIGDQGQVLTSVFPKLELLIGRQPPVDKLVGTESENRFNFVFKNFVEMIALEEKPLILFLDDMQWTDLVSIHVLKALITSNVKYLMIVLAYRDNEVDHHHPFQHFLDETVKTKIDLLKIKVMDLKLKDIENLINDSLNSQNLELAKIIIDKTHGNSFFVHQFIKSLIDNNLIFFDAKNKLWSVNLREISSLSISDNVVDLMQSRLNKLSKDTLDVLRLMGAVGHNIELNIFSIVSGLSIDKINNLIQIPLNDGMVLKRLSNIYFVHDKIQQACYQLNIKDELPKLHFKIANIFIDNGLTDTADNIFSTISHLSKGFEFIKSDYNKYISLYYQAAIKSKEISANSEYLGFIEQALKLINNDTDKKLIFRCRSEYHIALHLNAKYEEADAFFEKNIIKYPDILNLMDNYVTKVSQDSMLGNYKGATELGLSILTKVGVKNLTLEPTVKQLRNELGEIRAEFKKYGIENISDLKNIVKKDVERMEFICELVSATIPAAFFHHPIVASALIFTLIKLAIKNGVYEAMGYPFSTSSAPFIIVENNYTSGYEYGEFAMQISGNNKRSLGNSKHLFVLFDWHWMKPLKDNTSIEIARDAFHLLQQGGDMQMSGYTFFNTIAIQFERGEKLNTVLDEIEMGIDYITRTQNYHALGLYTPFKQFILTMTDPNANFTVLCKNKLKEEEYLEKFDVNKMGLSLFFIYKTQLLFMMKEYKLAYKSSETAKQLYPYITGFMPTSTYFFYRALTLCKHLNDEKSNLSEIDIHIKQFDEWSESCNENWLQKFYILNAEKYNALGKTEKAIDFYTKAVKQAKINEFTQDIALFYELFSDFWYKNDNGELGEYHIKEAYSYYRLWGATLKLNQLKKNYPEVFSEKKNYSLDLLTVIKAQNIIASETRIDKLLSQVIKTLLEISGAEKVFLILNESDKWLIEASINIQGNKSILESINLDEGLLSVEMVNYVIRAKTPVTIEQLPRIPNKGYLSENLPSSVLVLPVNVQSNLIAVIYLEHSKIKNLFSDDKIEMVKLISTQIAISLNNANIYNKLEELVNERTEELKEQNQKLELAQRKAEEATEAKSSFLANMSHEIRTPLNAIIGFSYILQQTSLSTKQSNHLKTIELSSRNLLAIINDILDFSKIEAGKLQVESIDFSFNDILDNLSSILMIKAKGKEDLEIVFDIDQDIPEMLKGDPLRFGQILINLANNAVKFTESGEIILSIKITSNTDNHIRLEVTVKDTGIGLNKKEQSKLFQKFSQSDTSTVRKYGGTGLGLAVSKELVELMGGNIWVKSKKNKGSIFGFNIQFEKSKATPILKNEKSRINLTGLKVLIVDDNFEMRETLKNMLGSLSFEVTAVSSGEEAIETIKRTPKDNPFRLAVVDWKMPFGIDGIETIKRISSILQFNAPKFIFLTAYDKSELIIETNALKIDAFMNKPVTPSMLYDTIADCFSGKEKKSEIYEHEKKYIEKEYLSLKGVNLLLVEDNEINREIVKEILSQLSINVFTAINGQEAVELICDFKNKYDLVLMDIQMPVLDGLTAAKIIREKGITKLPIIAMTAHAMKEDKIKSYSAGMNDHITKPILPDALFKTIKKWVIPKGIVSQEKEPTIKLKTTECVLKIKGINTEIGLTMLGNNQTLYKKLLYKFFIESKDTLEKINNTLLKNNIEECCRILHTIKGNSGSIGAINLHKASTEMETLLKKGKKYDISFEKFKSSLNDLRKNLESNLNLICDKQEKQTIKKKGTTEYLKAFVEEITPCIELQNINHTKEIINRIKLYDWSNSYNQYIEDICKHTVNFDFRQANKVLEELKDKLK